MKDLKRIEEILEKYYRGETTTGEENSLRTFFSGTEIPEHLKTEARLFTHFTREKDNTLTGEMEKRLGSMISGSETRTLAMGINRRFYWISAAAVILILLGLFLDTQIRRNSILVGRQDTFEDPYLAYVEAKKVLYLMSDKMNIYIADIQDIII